MGGAVWLRQAQPLGSQPSVHLNCYIGGGDVKPYLFNEILQVDRSARVRYGSIAARWRSWVESGLEIAAALFRSVCPYTVPPYRHWPPRDVLI